MHEPAFCNFVKMKLSAPYLLASHEPSRDPGLATNHLVIAEYHQDTQQMQSFHSSRMVVLLSVTEGTYYIIIISGSSSSGSNVHTVVMLL